MARAAPHPLTEAINAAIARKAIPTADILAALAIDDKAELNRMLSGEARFPVIRLAELAELLGVDPGEVLRAALREYFPERLEDVDVAAVALLTDKWRIIGDAYSFIQIDGPDGVEVRIKARMAL